MASARTRERISHVYRRLSMAPQAEAVAGTGSVDDAKARALDLSGPGPVPLDLPVPADQRSARDPRGITVPLAWWLDRMRSPDRMIEERLTWFWHDHFATSITKVRVPYLMYQQHLTLRRLGTGSFRDLLHAVAKDPAMLIYLDGAQNTAAKRNENFGRECMELFTVGRNGGYTQDDVVAASRSFTGWTIAVPGRRNGRGAGAPWTSYFVAARHDDGTKTLLGHTGNLDLDAALDVMLEHRSTAEFVAGKLYEALVGLAPDPPTRRALGDSFRKDWAIVPLVHRIVDGDAFTSDAALRAKVRTPLEKLVGLLQLAPHDPVAAGGAVQAGAAAAKGAGPVGQALRTLGYVPFAPPNVGGFPKGPTLLGPGQMVHSFDLLAALPGAPRGDADADDWFARFGLYDVSPRSRGVVAAASSQSERLALVASSPEYALT